jgi:hypothetical protein
MNNTIHELNKTLARCQCGSRAVMRYEPGSTYVHCIAEGITKAALPDWQPEWMAAEWANRLASANGNE